MYVIPVVAQPEEEGFGCASKLGTVLLSHLMFSNVAHTEIHILTKNFPCVQSKVVKRWMKVICYADGMTPCLKINTVFFTFSCWQSTPVIGAC